MLKIKKAIYGGLDVKNIIEEVFLNENTINVAINNVNFTDPMPNVFKHFEIQIDDNGTIKNFNLNENDIFVYPESKTKSSKVANKAIAKTLVNNPCGCGKK